MSRRHACEQGVTPDALKPVRWLTWDLSPLEETLLILATSAHIKRYNRLGVAALKIDDLILSWRITDVRLLNLIRALRMVAYALMLRIWTTRWLYLIICMIDWLRKGTHETLLRRHQALFVKTKGILDSAADGSFENLLHVLLLRDVLNSVRFLLVCNGLAHVYSVQIAPIAELSEAEIQVVAVEAEPITNSLGQHAFLRLWDYSLVWLAAIWLHLSAAPFQGFIKWWAVAENFTFVLDVEILQNTIDASGSAFILWDSAILARISLNGAASHTTFCLIFMAKKMIGLAVQVMRRL